MARRLYLPQPPLSLLRRPEAHLAIGLEHLVALAGFDRADVFFVQVGAFDGSTGDQLYHYVIKHGWRGILVEPQPKYYEELQRTYEGVAGLDLRNVAVAEATTTRELWAVREDAMAGLPAWAPQAASFDRSKLEGYGFRGRLESYPVECVPFSVLLYGVDHIDLLQIDVEGFDAEVVRLFDFDAYAPRIVRFESKHLSRADHNSAVARLLDYGYRVAIAGEDTIGWHD